jgi:hypothetical protein
MASLVLTTASCSNYDNNLDLTPQQPVETKGIPFTATIDIDETSITRALNEIGKSLVTTWAKGETVALIYNVGGIAYNTTAIVTAVNGYTGAATINAMLEDGTADGTDVTIIYPASAADGTTGNVRSDLLENQDGTLTGSSGTSISEKYDVRKGNGILSVDGSATFKNSVKLTNQYAIFKLTLRETNGITKISTKELVIKDASDNVLTTVNTFSDTDVMYVAIDPANTVLKFSVDNGSFFNMVYDLMLDKKYYQSTLKLATVGDVILSNGKCAKAGTEGQVAMICKLGSGVGYKNGLAIELTNEPDFLKWNNAIAKVASKETVPGCSWRLPSIQDWNDMLNGCLIAGGEDNIPTDDASSRSYRFFRSLYFEATGISFPNFSESYNSGVFWSSTFTQEDSEGIVWIRRVDFDPSVMVSLSIWDIEENDWGVLACLAF